MKRLCFVFILFTIHSILFSQNSKRTNVWYFGRNAGIDFNTNPPTPLSDGALNTWEGCATFCDTAGQLLIYTDGSKVWDRNHQVVPGGNNLGGNNSASQSGIIVPKPGSDSILYVFSVTSSGNFGGLRYAEFNMNRNNGFGEIVSSNHVLLNQCTEKVTAISHCNRKDYWLIAHEYGNDRFVVWSITNSGVSNLADTTSIGSVYPFGEGGTIGYLKASPDNSKLALAVYGGDFFEIFDFDNATGILSNPITLTDPLFNSPYAVEFSPDNQKLYLAGTQSTPRIFQVNLNLPTEQAIKNSITQIAQGSNSYFGAIQLAPDGKLYVAKNNSYYLSIIENPNGLGANCNFLEDSFYLAGKRSGIGLPNLINVYNQVSPEIKLTSNIDICNGVSDLQATFNIAPEDSFATEWYYMGNLLPEDSIWLRVDQDGEYEFKLKIYPQCQTIPIEYSKKIQVSLPKVLSIQASTIIHPACEEGTGSVMIDVSKGTPPYQYSIDSGKTYTTSNLFEDLEIGEYYLSGKDANNCVIHSPFFLDSMNVLSITKIDRVNPTCDGSNGSLSVEVEGGNGQLEVSLNNSPFQSGFTFNNLGSGMYQLKVRDEHNCEVSDTASLFSLRPPSITEVKKQNPTCNEANGSLIVLVEGGSGNIQASLNNGPFQSSLEFDNLSPGTYSIEVRDEEGCSANQSTNLSSGSLPTIKNLQLTPSSCNQSNGRIVLETSGGSGTVNIFFLDSTFYNTVVKEDLKAGSYPLTLEDQGGCKFETIINISEAECPYYLPNAFSPNGDGLNDFFRIFISPRSNFDSFSFSIFSRWGEIMYTSKNIHDIGWDGTFKGSEAPKGSYTYVLEYKTADGKEETKKGTLNLIR